MGDISMSIAKNTGIMPSIIKSIGCNLLSKDPLDVLRDPKVMEEVGRESMKDSLTVYDVENNTGTIRQVMLERENPHDQDVKRLESLIYKETAKKVDRTLLGNNFSEADVVDRVAFQASGMPYMAEGKKREDFFLKNPKAHETFCREWKKADSVLASMSGEPDGREGVEVVKTSRKLKKWGVPIALLIGAAGIGAIMWSNSNSHTKTFEEQFKDYVKTKGFDENNAGMVYSADPDSIKTLYENNKGALDRFLGTMNSSMVVQQVRADARIENKTQGLENVSKNLPQQISTIDQAYLLGNSSQSVTDPAAIGRAMADVKKYRIALRQLDEEPLKVHEAIAKMYMNEIEFPDDDVRAIAKRYGIDPSEMKAILVREAAEQIVRLVYNNLFLVKVGVVDVDGKLTYREGVRDLKALDSFYQSFIKPCLRSSVRFLRNGIATEYGDVDKIAYALIPPLITYMDMDVMSIIEIDVKGKKTHTQQQLETAIRNVRPREELGGLSIVELRHLEGLEAYGNGSTLKEVKQLTWFAVDNWPHTMLVFDGYEKTWFGSDPLKGLIKKSWDETDGKLPFARGYAVYLHCLDNPDGTLVFPELHEQQMPAIAALEYWMQGLPATCVDAIYPNGIHGHDEVGVWVNRQINKMIKDYGADNGYGSQTVDGLWHPWEYVKPFRADYEGKKIDAENALSYFGLDGNKFDVELPES